MRIDVTPWLAPERAELLDLLGSLSAEDWDRPTECPAWTVKGIALHILGDDLSLLSRQRDEAPSGVLLYAMAHPGGDFRALLDGFNEQWVTAASFLSPALVGSLLEATGRETAAYYANADLDAPGEPVGWFGATGPSPLWQAVARELVERWVHHNQILRAVGRSSRHGEIGGVVEHVALLGSALRMSGLDADEGDEVEVRMGERSWTLRRGEVGWMLDEGAPAAPRASVEVDAADVADRITLGPGSGRQPALGGDQALAAAVAAALSVPGRPVA